MMKWFFLGLLALLGSGVNLLLWSLDDFYAYIPALLAFNVALSGLVLIWHHAYFEQHVLGATGQDLGIVSVGMATGIFIVMWGMELVTSASCAPLRSPKSYRLRNTIAQFVEALGLCTELGYLIAVIGIGLTYVYAKLFLCANRQRRW